MLLGATIVLIGVILWRGMKTEEPSERWFYALSFLARPLPDCVLARGVGS